MKPFNVVGNWEKLVHIEQWQSKYGEDRDEGNSMINSNKSVGIWIIAFTLHAILLINRNELAIVYIKVINDIEQFQGRWKGVKVKQT